MGDYVQLIEYVTEEIDKEINMLKDGLVTTQAETYADYRATCGKIKGLETSKGILLDIMKRLEAS